MEEELKEIRFKVIPLWVPVILMIPISIPAIAFDISAGIYIYIYLYSKNSVKPYIMIQI